MVTLTKHLAGQHDQRTHAPERPAVPLVDLVQSTSRENVEATMERLGRPAHVEVREHGLLTQREFLTESLQVLHATRQRALERLDEWAMRGAHGDPLFFGISGHETYRRGMQERLGDLEYVDERIADTERALKELDPSRDPVEFARIVHEERAMHVSKHGSHDQQTHGRSQHGGARGLDDIEEAYTKQELLAFEADRKHLPFPALRDRYGAGLEDIWRASDVYRRARRSFRGGFVKMADEIAKHGNHDQKSHGRKGAGRDSLPTQSPHHDYSGQKYHGASEPGSAEAKEAMDYAEEVYDIYAERYFEGAEGRMAAMEMGGERREKALARQRSLNAKMKNLGELRDKAMAVYDGNRPMSDLKSVMRRVRLLDPRQPVLKQRPPVPFAKHRPGGKDHDQREHGKKKPGSGPEATASRPTSPIEPAKQPRPAAADTGRPENPTKPGQQPPPVPVSMPDSEAKSRFKDALFDSALSGGDKSMSAMERQEAILKAMEAHPDFGPEYVAHARQAMETAGAYYSKGKELVKKRGGPLLEGPFATEHLFDHIDGIEGAYTPERAAIQAEIVDSVFEEADARGAKRDAKALFMGGLPGAGKSTALSQDRVQKMLGVDLDDYIVINPDDIKERLVEEGLVPEYPGLSPMEASFLMHEESSKIAWDIATRAQTQGYNIVWDITMSSTGSVEKRIQQLQDEVGPQYEMQGLFVDVKPETSVLRAMGRHKSGMEKDKHGGRLVPPFVTLEAADDEYSSTNRRAFEQMKDNFSNWTLTTTEGEQVGGWRDPVVLESGQGKRARALRRFGKASSVMEDIRAYANGDMDFQSLTQRIAGNNFSKPSRFNVGAYGHAREGFSYGEEGTWDEVNTAMHQGLLSREEYLTLLNAAISQRSAKPKSPSLAQYAQGGGSGGGLSGDRPENPLQEGGSEPKEKEQE